MTDKTLVVGPFQCNCRLIACEKTGRAALIDPGDEAPRLLKELQTARTASGLPLQIDYLIHTHGHLDHIAATREIKENLKQGKILLHQGDEVMYQNLKMQSSMFGLDYGDPLPVDQYLEDGQELKIGELKLSVIHTPGHSPGSVCLRLHEDSAEKAPETIFSGDTLFKESVGRTDLWGANQDAMFKNIKTRLFTLDDDIRVCPGHGPETSIGHEKRKNPFFK